MSGPTVGLAIIAKNEEKRLPNLLGSIIGHFDQVVLVDTGSSDRTVQVFREWGKEHDQPIEVHRFKWTKDFAAARTFAHSKLTTEWEVWADCDDVIVGAQHIRALAARAPAEVAALVCHYNYAQHPGTGQCICRLKRERICRKGKVRWVNRVHEAQVVEGPVHIVDPSVIEWVHAKEAHDQSEIFKSNSRNLEILEAWIADEPENTRVLAYLGSENASRGDQEKAEAYYQRFLSLHSEWDEERAQVMRKYAMLMMVQQRFDEAIDLGFAGLRLLPQWPDSYLTLAEAHHATGQHGKAIEWAREALRRGAPETFLIINPLDYTFQPRKILAGSLASVGQIDEAVQVGTEAHELNPFDEALVNALATWRYTAKREHTANSVVLLAQQLVAHDEQLKALTLLEESVPHFAYDHPAIVAHRSLLRERLWWLRAKESFADHYATGGSKPEDFLPEDKIDEVCEALPRVAFLAVGITEQLTEQHVNAQIEKMMPQAIETAQGVLGGNPA